MEDLEVPVLAIKPRNAATHFRLSLLRPIAQIIQAHSAGDLRATLESHPFLAEYFRELLEFVGEPTLVAERWRRALQLWETTACERLPLAVLRASGLDELEIELLLATGLVEEDPQFAAMCAQLLSGERRPSMALLLAWWRIDDSGEDRIDVVRLSLAKLLRMGLLEAKNPNAPRSEWALCVPTAIWDALRGDVPQAEGLRFVVTEGLLPLAEYIPPDRSSASIVASLAEVLTHSPQQLIVLRGPRHNGRKTLAGAVAGALGKTLLVASEKVCEDAAQWRLLLALSLVMDAIPVVDIELAPGIVRALPEAQWFPGPVFVVTGMTGAVVNEGRPALNISLPLPERRRRFHHWRAVIEAPEERTIAALSDSWRLTSGNIRRAALSAGRIALLAKSDVVEPDHLRLACRGLQADRLETLATRLEAEGSLADLSVDDATCAELSALLARCRHRESLSEEGPAFAQGGAGVRALLAGPSGTGKTLAARLLAATLRKDLYRVDLAATVNKYLGETEKNLERAFAAAEELDVILLLDEGDALMTARTDVSSSNDRYANLETNFLLQRVESYSGVLLVTSNAADRIDKAFTRRMDAIIHFHLPDEWHRYQILNLHLPRHAIGDELLREIAYRCSLTGGQLRNVAMHARLLAMDAGGEVTGQYLCEAVQREYRKTGGRSPLKSPIAGSLTA